MIHKNFPRFENDYTDDFDTQFRPLPKINARDGYFNDSQYGFNPYSDDELFYRQNRIKK